MRTRLQFKYRINVYKIKRWCKLKWIRRQWRHSVV